MAVALVALGGTLVLAAEPAPTELPPPDHPMTFRAFQDGNARHGYYLIAEGRITRETPGLLVRRLREIDNANILTWMLVNSRGGDVIAALELGRIIRRESLRTKVGGLVCRQRASPNDVCVKTDGDFIDGKCESACAYAFLGGAERHLDLADFPGQRDEYLAKNTERLGFHQFFGEAPVVADAAPATLAAIGAMASGDAQYTSGAIARYLEEMGVASELLQIAANARPGAMAYPARAAMVRMRILQDEQFLPVRLQPDGVGVSAVSVFSNGGSRTRQFGFYCGVSGDGLPQTPRLVFSRARYRNGRTWLKTDAVVVPTFLSAIATMARKRGDEDAVGTPAPEAPIGDWQRAPPQTHVDGAALTADLTTERLPGKAIQIAEDANWMHIVMLPSAAFTAKLLSASSFSVNFAAAQVEELMHDPVLALDDAQRRAIAAAIRTCIKPE